MKTSRLKEIHWHGDTLRIVQAFPRSVRANIGSELYLLQIGERPVNSRAMPGVGRGVREIRVADYQGAFRVFYFIERRVGIHILHTFRKKTRKTPQAEIGVGRMRYRALTRAR